MSLHTIVHSGLASRLPLRRAVAATMPSRAAVATATRSIGSMRVLEMGLAVTAIATAVLLGQVR